jgi:hypothetical protein
MKKRKIKITIETDGKIIKLDLGKKPVPIYLILELLGKTVSHVGNMIYDLEEENYKKMKGGRKENGDKK